jgi:hypothetical protein
MEQSEGAITSFQLQTSTLLQDTFCFPTSCVICTSPGNRLD